MKEPITIILILIIIISGSILTQKYLNTSADSVIEKLEQLKGNIKQEEIEEEKVKEQVQDAYNTWKDVNQKWSIIVLHDELDLIETSLVKMKTGIEIGDYEDSLKELDTSIFLLNHIKEKEKTCLKNIF